MAKDSQKPKDNVLELSTSVCPVQGCGKKAARSKFCSEHFQWFKAGIITRDGEKPTDFDKKFQAFMRRKAA